MTSSPSVLMVSLAVVWTVVTAGESVRITETMTGVEMDVDAQSGANTIVLVRPRRHDDRVGSKSRIGRRLHSVDQTR